MRHTEATAPSTTAPSTGRDTRRVARARRAAALAVGVVLTVSACGGDEAEPAADAAGDVDRPAVAAEAPDYGLVTPQAAADLAERAGVTVIDVRTPEEYAEGHIDGALLIDFYDDGFADEIAALDPDGEYLVYCRSGNRSGQAVSLMRELGVEQVWDLDGGVVAYARAGLPLAR